MGYVSPAGSVGVKRSPLATNAPTSEICPASHSQGYVKIGRDYLKVGYYTEIFFVERDVRYIAINDGVDSAKGDNDFTPFRNLFNDFYAKDTSKKVRAIKRAQGMAGGTSNKAALRLHGKPN